MRISALNFERAYGDGLEDEYPDDVERRFTEWFDDMFLNTRWIEYSDADALIFPELTDVDKERVRDLIKEYSK